MEDEIRNIEHTCQTIENRLKEQNEELENSRSHLNEYMNEHLKPMVKEQKDIEKIMKKQKDTIDQFESEKKELIKDMTRAGKSMEKAVEKKEAAMGEVTMIKEQKFANEEMAKTVGDRPDKVREMKKIEKELKTLEKKRDEARALLKDIDTSMIKPNLEKWQIKYTTTDEICVKQKKTRICMRKSINERYQWLEDEKFTQAERCAQVFQQYCNMGDYSGRLMIRHTKRDYDEHEEKLKVVEKGSIEIRVRPPNKLQDVPLNSLSGGERSYVSVCFVCALWSVMDTPFKFLDEFDVFMDVKHRELAVNLLYTLGARTQYGTKQIFLLTPNDVRSKAVITDFDIDSCTVFSLKDPERR